MPKSEIQEQREELRAKRALYDEIFEEAKSVDEDGQETYDFTKVECLGNTVNDLEGAEKAKRVSEISTELQERIVDLDVEITTEERIKAKGELDQHFKSQRKRQPHAAGSRSVRDRGKSLSLKQVAYRVVEDPTFKAWKNGSRDGRITIDASYFEAKTIADPFQTTDGWAPEVTRSGVVVDTRLAPLSLSEILPRGATGQNSVAYMQQTVRTNAAAEVAEGALKAESDAAFEEVTAPVREIATWIPITDIVLEDAPFVASLIESQLRSGLSKRLDTQVMSGDGVAPNLTGLLNTAGIQTFDGASPSDVFSNLLSAGALIQSGAAFAEPTHLLMNPATWVRLATELDGDGRERIGNPQDMTARRVWSWPVIIAHELADNEAVIGSFTAENIQLVERRGITVERGLVDDQFIRDQQTLRATVRVAMPVYRPAAFVHATDIFGEVV